MRWMCITLLVLNAAYFGWQYTREVKRAIAQPWPQASVGTEPLKLLSELERRPSRRAEEQPAGTDPKLRKAAKQGPVLQEQLSSQKSVMAALAELPDCEVLAVGGFSAPFAPSQLRCHAIGPFASAHAALAYGSLLNKRGAQAAPREQKCKNDLGRFWVYLLPGKAPDSLSKQLVDLRQRGIQDFMAIHTHPTQDVISLGVYNTEKLARRRLEELRAKGLHPNLGPHYQIRERHWLDVKLATTRLPAKLPAGVRAQQLECNKIAVAGSSP